MRYIGECKLIPEQNPSSYTLPELMKEIEYSLCYLAKQGSGKWKKAEFLEVKVPNTFDSTISLPLKHNKGIIVIEVNGKEYKYTQAMVRDKYY